jgi:hypothetical protein
MCIRCRYKFLIEPLPSNGFGNVVKLLSSNDKEMYMQTHRLTGGNLTTPLRWTQTKYHKDWFRHSKIDRGDTQIAW